jgi:hypothetical protein
MPQKKPNPVLPNHALPPRDPSGVDNGECWIDFADWIPEELVEGRDYVEIDEGGTRHIYLLE